MPLVVVALGAYVAGLLAGYADSLMLFAALAAALCVLAASRGRVAGVIMVVLSLAGVVAAKSARRHDIQCARDAPHQRPIALVLDDSASPGAYVAAEVAGCAARAAVSVERGDAPAGSTVAAIGEMLQSQQGILIQHASIVVVRGPRALARWRAAAGRSIDRTFVDDAPLVRALLIADRRQLSPEIRDRFAAAGLAHILAIAGLHIGIIAAALALALDVAGVPKRRAAIVTVAVIVGYVALIGAPVPAVRAACMLVALFTSRISQRPTSRWAIVALGAMQPVIDPRVVLEVGYWLSVVGVSAMISADILGKRIGIQQLPTAARWVAVTIVGTTAATVATAPIVAWVFGRISVIAPLSNLAAGPLIALAQPMVFCGLVLAPLHPLAVLFANAAHPLLVALNTVARTGASVPGGSISVAPTLAAAVIGGVASIAVLVACAAEAWTTPAAVALMAAALLIWIPLAPTAEGLVEVHMIDVGQGDAIALRTPHSHWVLIDAGRAWRGGDAGRSTILPYLGREGGPLDAFVLSHPHTDHVGGAVSVLRAMHPRTYIDAGFPGPASAYRASLEVARTDHVHWARAHPGDSLVVDGVTLTFLAPDSAWTSSLIDPNLASVITLLRVGDVRILLMGDAERPEEEWLLAHEPALLRADILKVGHHGSITSSSEAFLDAVQPRVALVSVGAGNSYHLPTPSVMRALAAHGAQVLRTDQLGTVVARTDGTHIWIDAAGDSWEVPLHSPLRAP